MRRGGHSQFPLLAGLFLVSGGGLAYQIALTRLFSVAQWYHFAFMAVSLALLGFGASGSALAVWPKWRRESSSIGDVLWPPALLASVAALGGYLVANYLPFDSFRLGWEARQISFMALYYLALALPFFFCGLVVGLALSTAPDSAGLLYAANLVGSAAGCLLVLVLIPLAGGGIAAATAMPIALGAVCLAGRRSHRLLVSLGWCLALLVMLCSPAGVFLEPRASPYKGLSHALRLPGTTVIWTGWNLFSRVDLVASDTFRSAPGLSLRFSGPIPRQMAIAVDADNLSPISLTHSAEAEFTRYLPGAATYHILDQPSVLLIEPGGGIDLLTALHHDASRVVAVQGNPMVLSAIGLAYDLDFVGWSPLDDGRVSVVVEEPRSYVRRSSELFDVIRIGMGHGYQPITAGAFSLSEDYTHTVEAFADYYRLLAPGGVLVATRWLQVPPSEELRLLATSLAALKQSGVEHPERQIAAFRDFQTVTILIKRGEFLSEEAGALLAFSEERSYDIVLMPLGEPVDSNRFNVFPHDWHKEVFELALTPAGWEELRRSYPYDVRPATDDRPFFFHFFRWSQIPTILQGLGRTWQPFGGAGYLTTVVLLLFAVGAGAVFVILPLTLRPARLGQLPAGILTRQTILYFVALGFGFFFVEIPLLQKFILLLGQPTSAFAIVVAGLLVSSGLGSLSSEAIMSHRWLSRAGGLRTVLVLTAITALSYPTILGWVFPLLLGEEQWVRMLATPLLIAPLGFLMGIPFATGIREIGTRWPGLVPWAWATNGFASVVASILAAMLALESGFAVVLLAGALAYAVAGWASGPLTLPQGTRMCRADNEQTATQTLRGSSQG